jgi:nitrite reductase (NADH) small subunit
MLFPVAKLTDIAEGGSLLVEAGGQDIALFHTSGQIYAIHDRCPHAGASLSGGAIEDGAVICPWHYWCFHLHDGTMCNNPKLKVATYPVQVQDGVISVEVQRVFRV